MEADNRCRREVVVRYRCGGIGCAYFKTDKWRRGGNWGRSYCEYYVTKTSECVNGDAKAAADVAAMAPNNDKAGRANDYPPAQARKGTAGKC